ncbi:endonuclease domain-containing protein [Marisediminicola sp. LYQ134]|uniref:endonuclease domain-containing protein n=1 Tax=Marisediminicola sp. LYQ134 TaxID=3391061 RepID=UPI00398323D1
MFTLGHLARRAQLAQLGCGRALVDRALLDGRLKRVSPGWVATGAASQLAVIAVLNGGRLTGATALRTWGVWAGMDREIHVQVPPNSRRVKRRPATSITSFAPTGFVVQRVQRHWTCAAPSRIDQPGWRVEIREALRAFVLAAPPEHGVAACESAVHLRLLPRSEVGEFVDSLPRRLRSSRALMTFQAESGLESIAALRLRQLGFTVAQQVQIGRDRVDLMVDGWLVVELDGDAHHDPVVDRIRTNRLIRAGVGVLRFGAVELFDRWDETLATIEAAGAERIARGQVGR